MNDFRAIKVRISRRELIEMLNLSDDVKLSQITVNADGGLQLLLEGEHLPVVTPLGCPIDIKLDEIKDDGTITLLPFTDAPANIKKPLGCNK